MGFIGSIQYYLSDQINPSLRSINTEELLIEQNRNEYFSGET